MIGTTPRIDKALVERIGKQTDANNATTPLVEICRWRDHMVRESRSAKK